MIVAGRFVLLVARSEATSSASISSKSTSVVLVLAPSCLFFLPICRCALFVKQGMRRIRSSKACGESEQARHEKNRGDQLWDGLSRSQNEEIVAMHGEYLQIRKDRRRQAIRRAQAAGRETCRWGKASQIEASNSIMFSIKPPWGWDLQSCFLAISLISWAN